MSILIFRIICLISVLSCLYGLSAAAPISPEDTVRTFSLLSSVDHNTARGPVLRVSGSGVLRRGAAAELHYSVASTVDGSDTVLQPRGWVEDGSEFETIERRGIKEWFQNLGNKIKSGFQKVGDAFRHVGNKIKEGFQTAGRKIKEGFQTAGRKIKEGFQTAGTKIKEGFQTAGRKMKEGFQTAGRKIKEGFQVAGAKMKEGFQKAGKWIKETGAKVAKFGLKVVATIGAVASHVAKFIPIIGQPLSAALKVHSFAMNKASDAIHADLGSKLNKGMHVMDIIQDPLGYAVKKGAQHVMNHVQTHPRPSNGARAGPQFVPHARPQIKASPGRSVGRGKAGIATAVLRTAASAAQHRFAASRSSSRSSSRSPSRAASHVQQHFSASRSAARRPPAARAQQHFSAARSAARSAVRAAARTVQRHIQSVHRTSSHPAPARKSSPPPRQAQRHSAAPAPRPAQRHNNPPPRRNNPPAARPPPPAPKRGKGKGK